MILVDQEPEASLGGQAFWSFGGLFLVDSPGAAAAAGARLPRAGPAGLARHRRLRPRRGPLAAAVGRGLPAVRGGREARLAASEQGIGFFPVVGWAERGGYGATGPRQLGAALPHHLGHRPRRASSRSRGGSRAAVDAGPGRAALPAPGRRAGRHRRGGHRRARRRPRAQRRRPRRGELADRGRATSSSRAQAVVVTSGGIGGNHDLVRRNWPARLGPAPQRLLSGVPAHVDGRMLRGHRGGRRPASSTPTGCGTTPRASPTTRRSGRSTASGSCPGRRSLWLDATGQRLPVPLFPGFDTLGTLAHIGTTGHEHTWFVLTQQDRGEGVRPVGLRAEPRPDRQGREAAAQPGAGRRRRAGAGVPGPAARTSSSPPTLPELVAGMNRITGGTPQLDLAADRARGRRPRPRDRATRSPRTRRSPPSAAPATTSATS